MKGYITRTKGTIEVYLTLRNHAYVVRFRQWDGATLRTTLSNWVDNSGLDFRESDAVNALILLEQMFLADSLLCSF